MLSHDALLSAIPDVLDDIDADGLGEKYPGKVRANYEVDGYRVLVTTDRVSAFDRILVHIPYKGQVLNQLSAWWFEQCADIVPNHVSLSDISATDPNVTVGRSAQPLPVEVVVRGHITGVTSTALWTLYEQGVDWPDGLTLPAGLKKNDRLPEPVITPTTKATGGAHDERLTSDEVLERKLVDPGLWSQVCDVAVKLFLRGQSIAREAGLILVDTKYEFGLIDGQLALIDEMHTPDSSRYWIADTWTTGSGDEPENYDKEYLRLWFKAQGYTGDGSIPDMPDTFVADVASRYIGAFERLTGRTSNPDTNHPALGWSSIWGRWQTCSPTEGSAVNSIEHWPDLSGPIIDDEDDVPRDCCGVFGIAGRNLDVARTTFFGIYALQHRGQESAGIACSDGASVHLHRGMGRVNYVFDENSLAGLEGHLAIGHTRYSTTGASALRNAQPLVLETRWGPIAVAHNGNLTNHSQLRNMLLDRGVGLVSSSDTELIIQLLAAPPKGGEPDGPDWPARIKSLMDVAEGAYSLLVLTRDSIYGVRDPLGMRPLSVGTLETAEGVSPVIASESCSFGTIGADFTRDVEPGEVVVLRENHVHSVYQAESPRHALCIFEYVYLARPDSVIAGQMVHQVRRRCGELLWEEAPAEADVVIGVPDSAISAAIGYSRASGIPYDEGLMKSRYVGRTFIQPSDRLRKLGVSMKYNPLTNTLEGKRVVLVDDSIVRGNTIGPLVKMLRDGGALEVHVRVASPPVRHACYMGVDMASRGELIASKLEVDAIREHIGADSLSYLSFDGLVQAGEAGEAAYCHACFTGRYPLPIEAEASRQADSGSESIVER